MPSWLSKQVGPFPVGAWVLIIGAGLALGWFVNRRMGFGDEPPTLVPDTGRDTSAAGTGASQPRNVGPTLLNPAPPDQSGGAGEPMPMSNDEWVAMATRRISNPEGPTALATFEALTAYVRGEAITAPQRQIVNRAMVELGPPPFSPVAQVPDVPPAPPPTPTVPDPPSSGGTTTTTIPRTGRTLINTNTGRAAFTGPSGEGGLAYATAADKAKYPGLVSWQMPDGRTAWYVPGKNVDPGNVGALDNF